MKSMQADSTITAHQIPGAAVIHARTALIFLFTFLLWGIGRAANSPPNQPTFNSVPSVARLYPYTYPDVVNGPYTVIVDYTDPNGATDLQHVYLQLTGSGAAQTIMYQNMTTPVQWTGEGDHLYNITASKTAIANGYRVTFSFQIKSTWTPSSANVDFIAWGYDKSNAQGPSRTYDWNGTYDNNFRLVDARKTSLVDNDRDGYYSSVTIQADVGSALSSRTAEMLLYRRLDNGTGETNIWDSTQAINGTSVDWKGPVVTVTTRGIYDFYWALYDGSTGSAGWLIDEIWYNEHADISNIPMEPASEDIANSAPNQPTFNTVPTVARLYPYTYPDAVNGPYTVIVDYTDSNGAADLKNVYLQIKGDGPAQTIMYYNMTTVQQWTGEGDHLYDLGATKSAIANGYRVTFTFQIKSTWTPSANVDFEAWALDQSSVEGTHRTYDWNGTYDNNFRLVDARKTSLVDNDGDGYYSSVTIQADVGSALSSRSAEMLLYRRLDNGTGETNIWDSTQTIDGTAVDWKGPVVTVATKGIYDFYWALYDGSAESAGWFIDDIWYATDPDISSIPMEPASMDVPQRGMYVDWVGSIVGNRSAEISILEYAKQQAITYLAFYVSDTHPVLLPPRDADFSRFLQLAKSDYGIRETGFIGGTRSAFDAYVAFRSSHPGQLDVMNLEMEFWNSGNYVEYLALLQYMRAAAASSGLRVETYVGSPTTKQIQEICTLVDRLLIDAYVTDPAVAYNATRSRILDVGTAGPLTQVWPIFSAESSYKYAYIPYMGNWLKNNSLRTAELRYLSDYGADTDPRRWKACIDGFQYYSYNQMSALLFLTANSFSPSHGATQVPPSTDLQITFTDVQFGDINIAKGTGGSVYLKYASSGTIVETIPVTDQRVVVSGNRATVRPATTLQPNTTYAVCMDSSCFKVSSGLAQGSFFPGITSTVGWQFTTGFGTVAPTVAARLQTSTIVFTWPTNAPGFVLMSTTNLATNAVWTQVSPAPVVVSGQNVVSNSISGSRLFYRLKK